MVAAVLDDVKNDSVVNNFKLLEKPFIVDSNEYATAWYNVFSAMAGLRNLADMLSKLSKNQNLNLSHDKIITLKDLLFDNPEASFIKNLILYYIEQADYLRKDKATWDFVKLQLSSAMDNKLYTIPEDIRTEVMDYVVNKHKKEIVNSQLKQPQTIVES